MIFQNGPEPEELIFRNKRAFGQILRDDIRDLLFVVDMSTKVIDILREMRMVDQKVFEAS